MIASGGDTLALLSCQKTVSSIVAVDANAAQLSLCRLKLALLSEEPLKRRAILGHECAASELRRVELQRLGRSNSFDLSDFGPSKLCLAVGPDFCGRYERLFAALQWELSTDKTIQELLVCDDVDLRREILLQSEVATKMRFIFDKYFALPSLVELFGAEATQNPMDSFSHHFYKQTLLYLQSSQSVKSPFLQQFLRGHFSGDEFYEWLKLPPVQERAPVHLEQGLMLDYMKGSEEQSFDFIHLSNILDWLSPRSASELLEHSFRLLRPGGKVFIRQLNSSLDVEKSAQYFDWQREEVAVMLARDKSFFYRKLHLGMKKC